MKHNQLDDQIKNNFEKYMKNLCVVCIHNNTCALPLHGKLSINGEPCPQSEPLAPLEMKEWILKNVYGLPAIKLKS